MKHLWLTAFFFAVSFSVYAQNVSPNTAPTNSQQKADKTQNPDSTAIEQSQVQSKEEKAKAASLDYLYRWYMRATIIGVVGGFIGIGLLIWQSILSRRSANAAWLNAQAVISSERPWITIISRQEAFSYSFWANNQGRTPAEIISLSVECRAVDNINGLPPEPEYTNERTPAVSLLVPTNPEAPDLELLPVEDVIDFANKEKPKGKWDTKAFVFYFRIRYKNVLSQIDPSVPDYETRKCYCYQPQTSSSLSVCGPKKYNGHT